MNSPLLSIIILSYNTADITSNCLRSILTDKGLLETPYEIIVVDNASTDDSVSQISKFKNVKLIKNKSNLGFAKANNQGIKIARGNYLLFLNSDTIILHSAISQALDWLSSNPSASACTAQLLNPDKSIQMSGGFFPNIGNVFTWSFGLDDLPLVNFLVPPLHPHTPNFYTHDSFFLHDHFQDWITGAFMLVRRQIVNTTHGFDNSYFLYGEELEWCYRIKSSYPNQEIWYLVGPQIIHLGGASSTDKSSIINHEMAGIQAFFKKHRPSWQYPIVSLLLKTNVILRSTIYRLFSK